MRLLRPETDGTFSLVEFAGREIPRYAILSHTWGADDEEVTLKDLADDVGKSKPGYRKIIFCGEQAAKDGLQFFWVDTCCIDKSSSAELSEAINSMFRWYHNAVKCYVYLSDVSISDSIKNSLSFQQTQNSATQHSRWFTRSWTLQELLAPTSIEFFSAEGDLLGNRSTLLQEIHSITGISIQALEGKPLSHFSVDERMSWAEGREAKREEDLSYSLLGIFDTHMPLIYGEGRQKALARLRREIVQELGNGQPALPPLPSTEQLDPQRNSFSTIPLGRDFASARLIDASGRFEAPVPCTATRDSIASQTTRSVEEAQTNKPVSPSFNSYDNSYQFNALGGIQNNNSGSGNQFITSSRWA